MKKKASKIVSYLVIGIVLVFVLDGIANYLAVRRWKNGEYNYAPTASINLDATRDVYPSTRKDSYIDIDSEAYLEAFNPWVKHSYQRVSILLPSSTILQENTDFDSMARRENVYDIKLPHVFIGAPFYKSSYTSDELNDMDLDPIYASEAGFDLYVVDGLSPREFVDRIESGVSRYCLTRKNEGYSLNVYPDTPSAVDGLKETGWTSSSGRPVIYYRPSVCNPPEGAPGSYAYYVVEADNDLVVIQISPEPPTAAALKKITESVELQ